jgi:hypothetical protein
MADGSNQSIDLPGRNTSPWRFASELGQHAVCLVKHVPLLFHAHIDGIFVTVTVKTNLVSSVAYCSHVFWKSLQTMAWNKPCGLHVILLEELQEALRTDCASKQTARNVAGTVFSAVRSKPPTYRIYVNTIRNENALLAHDGCVMREDGGGLSSKLLNRFPRSMAEAVSRICVGETRPHG